MSKEMKEIAIQNCILEVRSGSHLYGTSTPESDEDFTGIFIPPEKHILGLNSIPEVNLSIIEKNIDGKNTKDAVDRKFYEFRKFIHLALGSNPNILEILFADKNNVLNVNHYGEMLLEKRNLFISQKCIPKFLGYAQSQKHKMIIRRDHFNELHNGYGFLQLMDPKLTMGQVHDRMLAADPKCRTFWKKNTGSHIHCGDICFEPGVYAKKASRMLKDRLDKATSRSELVLKHGFDTKFASHLIRLLQEGLTLLREGAILFPLTTKDTLLDIKRGKWDIKEVLEYAEQLEKEYVQAGAETSLPKSPNYRQAEKFVVSTLREFLYK